LEHEGWSVGISTTCFNSMFCNFNSGVLAKTAAYGALTAQEVGTLAINTQGLQLFGALENMQTPPLLGLHCVLGFRVLELDA